MINQDNQEGAILMEKQYEEIFEEMPVKNKKRAERRKKDFSKAMRKKGISVHNYGTNWYSNLHEYSKNKVHCSCGMCRFKSAWCPDAKTYSDMKKNERDAYSLKEYKVG